MSPAPDWQRRQKSVPSPDERSRSNDRLELPDLDEARSGDANSPASPARECVHDRLEAPNPDRELPYDRLTSPDLDRSKKNCRKSHD